MMAETKAWILQFNSQHRAAVGQRELLHLNQTASRYPVPLTPAHCHEVIYWQGRPIPLLNLAILLGSSDTNTALQKQKYIDQKFIDQKLMDQNYIGIVGYQTKQGEAPQLGAIWLTKPPSLVIVSDDQACSLSKAGMEWSALATACFNYEDDANEFVPVPVLDLMRIFAPNVDGVQKRPLKSPVHELTL